MRFMSDLLMALDQGSTTSKAVLMDRKGRAVREAVSPLKTDHPRPGWVEQDPGSILASLVRSAERLLRSLRHSKTAIAGLGISNQRSTIILWDKMTGRPLLPAISWQDLRADRLTRQWLADRDLIRSRTGLMLTPYYSAPKIRWILDHVKGARAKAEKGRILCGTVNTYLIWHLTKGETHATDGTNAARMLLMNLEDQSWDKELLSLFGIPPQILPRILPTVADYGTARLCGINLPIRASIGDQQAALLGLGAFRFGEAVINYGTGGFFLVNTGADPILLPGLLSSLAWNTRVKASYLIEGTVNSVGTVFEWLRGLGVIRSPAGIDRLLKLRPEGCFSKHHQRAGDPFPSHPHAYLVPALSGIGAPHWLDQARTAFFGFGASTSKADLVRAAVEGIAFRMKDIDAVIGKDRRVRISRITASGGGSHIDSLVQTQADWLGRSILRSDVMQASLRGAALLAGVGCGWWDSPDSLPIIRKGRTFQPRILARDRDRLFEGWKKAVEAVRRFTEEGKGI